MLKTPTMASARVNKPQRSRPSWCSRKGVTISARASGNPRPSAFQTTPESKRPPEEAADVMLGKDPAPRRRPLAAPVSAPQYAPRRCKTTSGVRNRMTRSCFSEGRVA